MKKILAMGASALALGIGASAAHADDPMKLTLSGGAQEAFGYVGNANNKDNGAPGQVYEFGDGSIDFDAKTKLDSGITVEFNAAVNISGNADGASETGSGFGVIGAGKGAIATAAGSGGKTIKTSENDWIAFSGSFGKLEIGDDFNAAFQAHNDAPYEGAIGGFNWNRNIGFIAGPRFTSGPSTNGNGPISTQSVNQDDYESTKVVYTTPSFAGFGVTASYTPSISSGDVCCGPPAKSVSVGGGDLWAGALFYKGDVGDAKLNADFGYVFEDAGSVGSLDGGVSVTYKGFTLGGAIGNRKVVGKSSQLLEVMDWVGTNYEFGVGYDTGPWGVTVGYMHNAALATGSTTATGLHAIAGDVTWYMVPVTVKYNLGPGITLNLEAGYMKWNVPDGTASDQIDGMYSLLGTTVSF